MPVYAVIYDQELELGVLVDLDSMRAIGPVSPGPNARQELEAFVTQMPPAFLTSPSVTISEAYREFWGRTFAGNYAAPAETDPDTVGAQPSPAGDASAALADHEASNATTVPEPQPADTDVDAGTGTASDVTPAEVPLVSSPAPSLSEQNSGVPSSASVASGGSVPASTPQPAASTLCPFCNGSGTIHLAGDLPDEVCNACKGSGRIKAAA